MSRSSVPIDRPGPWSRVRRAFAEFLWLPTVVMAAFFVAAAGVIWLDRSDPGWLAAAQDLIEAYVFGQGGSTHAFLGMATTGLITMTSITFSMLLLALQQSASMIGAQVVYSFLLRRRNQVLLGFFLGVTLFVLLIRAVAHEAFNPLLGATAALLLLATALFALAYLLFTTVNQMRPQTVVESMRTMTLEARRKQRDLLLASYRSPRYTGGTEVLVRTEKHGYLRNVDVEALRTALRERRGEAEIEIRLEIGDYVAYGEELARVRAERPEEARRLAGVARAALRLDVQRAVRRDPSFGVHQIQMIGWSSGSTAYHNPGISLVAVRNLRDIMARWAADYEAVEGSDGTVPLVYPDGLVENVIEAMEAIAVVSTESLQPVTFREVMVAYCHVFPLLPAHLKDRTARSMRLLVTALGDLVLTPMLEDSLGDVADVLRQEGFADTAAAVDTAKRQMASVGGHLGARSTRARQARPNGSGG